MYYLSIVNTHCFSLPALIKRTEAVIHSITCECLSAHIVGTDACFMYLPGKAIFQIMLSCTHSFFSFPALIYFFSFWPLLSPRQFSPRKTAESATSFHSEVKLEVLKSLACNPSPPRLSKYCKSLSFSSPPLHHFLLLVTDELNYVGCIYCWQRLVNWIGLGWGFFLFFLLILFDYSFCWLVPCNTANTALDVYVMCIYSGFLACTHQKVLEFRMKYDKSLHTNTKPTDIMYV